jgi:DNA-directed RNA polymerase
MAKNRFNTRFVDMNEEGFLAAAGAECDGVILDYLTQQSVQKSINRKILVSAAKRQIEVAGSDSFSFGTFLDWRGRLYYHGAGVAPQGKDFGRGAIIAAEGVRLGFSGLRHLMAGVATTWGQDGIDKATVRNRVRYVRRMLRDGSLRRMVAEAQDGSGYEWRLAEEPVQFVALAADLIAALDSGTPSEYVSATFVGYDATCSGLQILAAVTGCAATASLVNVAPRADGKRADIYISGGEGCMDYCRDVVAGMSQAQASDAAVWLSLVADAEAEVATARAEKRERDESIMADAARVPSGDHWALYWLNRGVTRNLMKKPVMVYCYGGTKRTFAAAFREDSGAPWKACMWLAAVLYDEVLATMLPKAHAFMLALQEMARALCAVGKPVDFKAADGLPFHQSVMETEKGRVRCHLNDGRSLYVVTQNRTNKLSSQRQASGIAPNIVHHWDALFLRNVVRALADAGIDTFFTVHDCFYLRAGDWARGWKIIRETFIATFSGDVAAEVWQQIDDSANGLNDRDEGAEAWENEGGMIAPDRERTIALPTCPAKGTLDLAAVRKSEFLFS